MKGSLKVLNLRGKMEDNTNTNTTTNQPATEASKVYTQEEVEKLVQAEADRRVTQALSKKEREMSKKLTEAEKLSKMSEEDKYRYQLEQKEAELAAKEKEFALRDNKIAAMKVMSDKGIPADLVDFVVDIDADTMNANINKLDKFIKQAVASEVKARLASPTPAKGLASNTEITKEQFARMSIAERNELFTNNRELYNKLKG